ncbi:AraC-type DNA-binding protein [Corynebacterium appendicis CIP 107643]|uniref:AraC-type DNA-binding protein n=1 Tax=Corynebacterium appendicis CIP 107643 TaxID=1161099 RepID=A0A1N7IVL4_9CORY|nr:helix-turn-helix domain-containing protein [Corynebacterium appendicis]WJY61031.1 Transcriptional activator NphR [Corynebacterium appendicis CIP 107643]SIS41084.1 AraC-type DNA-binding protein [Corynebacterium appendicis CIP 107643]
MQVESFSTDDVAFYRRIEYWQDVVTGSFARCAVRVSNTDETFYGRMVTGHLGPVTFSLAEYQASSGYEITRTSRHVRQEETDDFLLQLHLGGGKIGLTQNDRESTIERPGDFSVLDDSIPSTLYCPPDSSARAVTASMSRSLLVEKVPHLRDITALHIDGQTGTGQLLSSMVVGLASNLETGWLSATSSARLSSAFIDVLSVALLEAQGSTERPPEIYTAGLLESIYRFVEKNLSRSDLTVQLVADAHHISLRYLHRLFEKEDATLGEWIRNRRLDSASRQLIDPAYRHIPVSKIGANWGFPDPSAFSRAFRARFEMPPRDYRTTFLSED